MLSLLTIPSQPTVRFASYTLSDHRATHFTVVQQEQTLTDYPTNYTVKPSDLQLEVVAGGIMVLVGIVALQVWVTRNLLKLHSDRFESTTLLAE
jgi:hypothetical protein